MRRKYSESVLNITVGVEGEATRINFVIEFIVPTKDKANLLNRFHWSMPICLANVSD